MEIIPAEPRPFEHMLALPQADWLPVQFVKDPLSFAESSDHIDVATAGICLRLHFCYTNQQARSKEDLRAQLAASQAGTRVLSWFLNSEYHKDMKTSHLTLLKTIAFGVVAEGSTSFLWEMLMLSHDYKRIDGTSDVGTYDLMSLGSKIVLLMSLLEAQAFWSMGSNKFNKPLESFHKAQLEPSLRSTASQPYRWLVKCLTLADKTGIDVGRYERFVENIPNYEIRGPVFDRDLETGFLQLVHPTRPDPRKLLQIFHDAVQNRETMQQLEDMSSERLKRLSRRLVYHCHHAGETTEARFVVNTITALLHRKLSSPPTSGPVDARENVLHESSQTQSG